MNKRTKVKKKKSTAPKKTAPIKMPEKKKTIPTDKLENFVGYVENIYKIDCKWVFPDGDGERFRVNVYSEEYVDNSLYPRIRMSESYSLYYDGQEIIDKTIRQTQ